VTFSGGCAVEITPAELKDIIDSLQARRPIPPELRHRYEMISPGVWLHRYGPHHVFPHSW
jgi:hypothetical protein